jgi:hypothetical protein
MHHSDAAEARNFAEHMAVCGCLGVVDHNSGCLRLNWSKVRYFRDPSRTPPILRFDADFCRMVDVSTQFVAARAVHGIVDVDWFRSVVSRVSDAGNGQAPHEFLHAAQAGST